MKIAIVAHYDSGNIWEYNFIELLRALNGAVDKIIVITTSERVGDLPVDIIGLELIRRPNIGYDFYSYRVGVHLALSKANTVSGLFLLNSSLLLLEPSRFKKLLKRLSRADSDSSVRGVTESSQISWHLQSYLIYFDLIRLPKSWVQDFFNKVEPVNDKFEVVVKYEIGLGHALMESGILVEAIFKPSFFRLITGTMGVLKSRIRRDGFTGMMRSKLWGAWKEVNWTHFAADLLALNFGIAKAEFLRTNPHKLPEQRIWDSCNVKLRESIEQLLERTRHNYAISKSGLTEINCSHDPLGIIKYLIFPPRNRIADVKVAVVVHLFYLDLLGEILEDLGNILEPYDLFITTPFEADLPKIINEADRRNQSLTIVLAKNAGRDVGPFIALFRTGTLDEYDAILKLHSKKSRYSEKGDFWRRELFGPLCGNSLNVLRSISLIRENGCGIVGPRCYFLTNPLFWGANKSNLSVILNSSGLKVNAEEPPLYFFAGTMFWFSPKALKAIHLCEGPSIAFEPENGKQDATLAHAWERAFCILARDSGFAISAIGIKEVDLFSVSNLDNRVPVLRNA